MRIVVKPILIGALDGALFAAVHLVVDSIKIENRKRNRIVGLHQHTNIKVHIIKCWSHSLWIRRQPAHLPINVPVFDCGDDNNNQIVIWKSETCMNEKSFKIDWYHSVNDEKLIRRTEQNWIENIWNSFFLVFETERVKFYQILFVHSFGCKPNETSPHVRMDSNQT